MGARWQPWAPQQHMTTTERERLKMMHGVASPTVNVSVDSRKLQESVQECIAASMGGASMGAWSGGFTESTELIELLEKRKEKESQMRIYQVFFVHKETKDLLYNFTVADCPGVATMKAAAECSITADEIDDFEVRHNQLHSLDVE